MDGWLVDGREPQAQLQPQPQPPTIHTKSGSKRSMFSLFHLGFDWILKEHVLPSESFIDSTKSFELCLSRVLLLWVKVSLEHLGSVSAKSGSLSHNLSWVADVRKKSFVDGSQGPGSRPSKRVTALRWLHDFSVSYNNNVLSAKLLLELSHESLLNLHETFAKTERDVDDDGLATTRNIDFLCGHNIQVSQVALELSTCSLKVKESLCNTLLEAIWGYTL